MCRTPLVGTAHVCSTHAFYCLIATRTVSASSAAGSVRSLRQDGYSSAESRAEIDELYFTVLCDKDIFRADIPVDHAETIDRKSVV